MLEVQVNCHFYAYHECYIQTDTDGRIITVAYTAFASRRNVKTSLAEC